MNCTVYCWSQATQVCKKIYDFSEIRRNEWKIFVYFVAPLLVVVAPLWGKIKGVQFQFSYWKNRLSDRYINTNNVIAFFINAPIKIVFCLLGIHCVFMYSKNCKTKHYQFSVCDHHHDEKMMTTMVNGHSWWCRQVGDS